jgi:hypothetical protein
LKLATSAVTIVIGHYTQKRESGASTASRARRPCPMISLVMLDGGVDRTFPRNGLNNQPA